LEFDLGFDLELKENDERRCLDLEGVGVGGSRWYREAVRSMLLVVVVVKIGDGGHGGKNE
jgi:hypothetical protein